MSVLSFEFPIKPTVTKAQFAAQVIAWVRGMNHSRLLEKNDRIDIFSDEVVVSGGDGESLVVKEVDVEGGFVSGVRYDCADLQSRIWRTEITLTAIGGGAALRSRSECIPLHVDAKVQAPKKPYFIKLALDDDWGGVDGEFEVQGRPIEIGDIDTAFNALSGYLNAKLPIIYFTREGEARYLLKDKTIESLAYQLGGIAHVLIEKDFETSKRIAMRMGESGPIGGAAFILVPEIGIVRSIYGRERFGGEKVVSEQLLQGVSSFVTNRKPRIAWDFQALTEESMRQLRKILSRKSENFDKWLEAQESDILAREKEERRLQETIDGLQSTILRMEANNVQLYSDEKSAHIGRQLYKGEFSDRLRSVLEYTLEECSLNDRTRELIVRILDSSEFTGRAGVLEERIKSAGRDSGKADARLADILLEIGFIKARQKGHPVYEPVELFGLQNQILSCTPSDHHSGRNASAQIIRMLGLAALKKR